MKVTMVGSLPPIKGGISDYCMELAAAVSRSVEVDFITFRRIYPERLYPGGTIEPGKALRIPPGANLRVRASLAWYNPVGWLWAGLRFKGDLLHIQWWTYYLAPVELAILLSAKLRRKPVVMTMHNVLAHETNRLDRVLTRLTLRFPDRFIVHTGENRRQLREIFGVDERRVSVIPLGTFDFYAEGDMSREEARRELGLTPEGRVLLAFGNIREYKGVDVLLRAFRRVADAVPRAKLVIAGACWTGWDRYEKIIDELRLRDRLLLSIGFVPSEKVKVFFRAADLAALPYLHFEAQSAIGNIALAFGLPMVVTRTGGLPDLVRDPDAVVPPDDEEALAKTLIACLNDEGRLRRWGADSTELAGEFSWSRIGERTIRLYEEVILERAK